MIRKYVIPLLAAAGVLFAVWTAVQSARPVAPALPVTDPPKPVFSGRISGSGIVEASSRNISIGTHVPGIVRKVLVRVGDRVRPGEPLFVLDDRRHRAELAVRMEALAGAEARLRRLKAAPREEELPAARARVQEAEAVLADARAQRDFVEGLKGQGAVSMEDETRRRYAFERAEAALARAKAELALLESGAWKADVEVAEAEAALRRAEAEAAGVELERLTVAAPVAGEVLQVNIRPGEFAQAGANQQPLVLLGSVDVMHVRVDIDENDAWRFSPDAKAVAYLRGHTDFKTDLTFQYVEKYVVPKRSLTGESTERVDTRVLQVVYSFSAKEFPVYAGQLVDVYIEDRTGSAGGDKTSRPGQAPSMPGKE